MFEESHWLDTYKSLLHTSSGTAQILQLVALDTSIRLAVLGQTAMLGRLVVSTGGTRRLRSSSSATRLASLLSGLSGVDLAVGELYIT